MPVAAGSKLGPYQVKSSLGVGGMGEVFRARDTRLNRDVAVKIMHDGDGSGVISSDRKARFEREAKTVAALNHPNIVSVFDFGAHDGVQYAVSELVEGETLRALIRRGPVPVRKLVDAATQMADGLAAAHAAGVVHRDLKPENVMLTKDGRVKILDFGLARQNDGLKKSARAAGLTASTLDLNHDSEQLTHAGAILGTATYMSPEQAAGSEVDSQTDQFAFGLILYEMASGKRAFERATTVETLAAIVREEAPPLEAKIPPPLHWILDRCLQKDPEQRYESTRDLYQDLKALRDHLSEAYSSGDLKAVAVQQTGSGFRMNRYVVAGAGLSLLVGTLLVGRFSRPAGVELSRMTMKPFAHDAAFKFWSPDGKTVAFSSNASGKMQISLKRLGSSSETVILSRAKGLAVMGWANKGSQVLFTENGDHFRDAAHLELISSAGGEPEAVMDLGGWGTLSADGTKLGAFLQGDDKNAGVWISDPLGSELKQYLPAPFKTKEVAGWGWVAFAPDGQKLALMQNVGKNAEMWILPYPAGSRAPFRVFEKVRFGTDAQFLSWMPDSRHGVMSFRSEPTAPYHLWYADTVSGTMSQLTFGTTGETWPVVSPDGKTVLFEQQTSALDIVSTAIGDGATKTLVHTGWNETDPSWDRDTEALAYISDRNGTSEIWLRGAGGSERPVITKGDFADGQRSVFTNPSLSPDGRRLIYCRRGEDGSRKLWLSGVSGGEPIKLTNSPGSEWLGSWSPDGSRFSFYQQLNGIGNLAVVKASGNAKTEILKSNILSVGGWSPDGKSLTYEDEEALWHVLSSDGKSDRELPKIYAQQLIFSKDGRSLYGLEYRAGDWLLISVDIVTGAMHTIRQLEKSEVPLTGLTGQVSLSPDGKSITYSRQSSATNQIWTLQGFEPQSGWSGWKWPWQ